MCEEFSDFWVVNIRCSLKDIDHVAFSSSKFNVSRFCLAIRPG